MKTLKVISIALMICSMLMVMIAVGSASAEEEQTSRLAVVTAYERVIDSDEWIISCTDKDGNIWSFKGEEEDAHIGYLYNLLMIDDRVVDAYCKGRLTDDALFAWLTGEWQ